MEITVRQHINDDFVASPTDISGALMLIDSVEYHKHWADLWVQYALTVEVYNNTLQTAHDNEMKGWAVSPCPVDLSKGLVPGSDDEWAYQEWVKENQAPTIKVWSVSSSSTCPDWLAMWDGAPSEVRDIAETFNGGHSWHGIMTDPKAVISDERKIEGLIPRFKAMFWRLVPTAYPAEYAKYKEEKEREQEKAEDEAARERMGGMLEASFKQLGAVPQQLTSLDEACSVLVNFASQLEILAEVMPMLATNSQQLELRKEREVKALSECAIKLYACNSGQLKGVQELCRWLAAGRTGSNTPISVPIIKIVYGWLIDSLNDASIKNGIFDAWFNSHVDGTRLHNAICQRIGVIPPKSVVVAVTRSQNFLDSL